MQVTISIEDKARTFLQQKNKVLTIFRTAYARGCMTHEELDISYALPTSNDFERYVDEDLTIYVQKGLVFQHQQIKIALAGVGPFKTIAVGTLKKEKLD